MKLCLILMLALPLNLLYSQESSYDGHWWNGLETKLAADKYRVDDPSIVTRAYEIRMIYILGIIKGMAKARDAGLTTELILKDTPYLENVRTVNRAYDLMFQVKADQWSKGLFEFYKDYKNLQVEVIDAMEIVALEVTGQSKEEVEWRTRFFRANEETRSKMIKEKYLDKK